MIHLNSGVYFSRSLQDEFTQSQGELRRLLSDRQAQQEKVQLLLAERRGEMMDKTRELEELRLQVHFDQEERKKKKWNSSNSQKRCRFTLDWSKVRDSVYRKMFVFMFK